MASNERYSITASNLDPERVEAIGRIAFPRLDEQQLSRIREVARERTLANGETLWSVGERTASFFVVLSGEVEIRQPDTQGKSHLIVRHGPGGFTGDVDLLSPKASVVEGVAYGETQVLEVCPDTLKRLVVADSQISDTVLAAFMARRRLLMMQGMGDITLIGSRYSPEVYALREFLERNSRPFRWIDVEADETYENLLEAFRISPEDTPAVITSTGKVCRNPSVTSLAANLGLSDIGDERVYDMVVVGAGPAGLAASVYGGSEGLDVVVLDATAPGGQAGTSSKIENYLGFPMGISGRELAQNALMQAEKFGVRFVTPRRACGLIRDGKVYVITLENDKRLRTRTLCIATGVFYRRLPAQGAANFEGRGIYFGATGMEAELCRNEQIAIVGGGNSAGQAAVFLSKFASKVHILIRSGDLEHSMSRYLINRIESLSNVKLHKHTQITHFQGNGRLEQVHVRRGEAQDTERFPVRHVFVFIGAAPNTDWLQGGVSLDEKGFVCTGPDVPLEALELEEWGADRRPFIFETNRPGVFAAGDVRSGSTKRVASAVGEGSVIVQFVHKVIGGVR